MKRLLPLLLLSGCISGNVPGDLYPDTVNLLYGENRGDASFEHSSWLTDVNSDLDGYNYGVNVGWVLTDRKAEIDDIREFLPQMPPARIAIVPDPEHDHGDGGNWVSKETGIATGSGGALMAATWYIINRRKNGGTSA